MKKILFIFTILLLLVSLQLAAQTRSANQYLVRTFIDENGDSIDEIIVPGRPPEHHREPAVEVPQPPYDRAINILTNVPAFDWSYGCSATSAAMIAGHYDNTIFPDMYTGPTNGGVMPMNNSAWGNMAGECPLSATHMGFDGLGVRGHVDDYWISYGSTANDPYITGGWTAHSNADCTADYMGTNQSALGSSDGSTTFYNYTDGTALYDYSGCEPAQKDGCHGFREFFNSRGYNMVYSGGYYQNYSQYIYGYDPDGPGGNPPNTLGFTYAQFMAEIDAGRPVMIQVDGHTMVGYGYDDSSNLVYIHDTWDYLTHTMTWGGSYSGMAHYGVSVFVVDTPNLAVTAPNGGENWNLGSTHNITWYSSNVNNVDISLYNSGSLVMPIVSNYSASLGSFSWPIPTGLAPSSTYKIRISISGATTNYDESDNNFTLQAPPSITVQTPNGGEIWELGTQQMINWTSANNGPNVNIELYSGSSFHSSIISNTPDTGIYPWDITTSTVSGTQYTIKIEDVTTPTTNDYSDSPFTLSNPPGFGQADNSSDPTLPVIIDVEQIIIDGLLVDPNAEVDPPCDVALNVTIQTYADAQNTIDYPDEVGISYEVDITGDYSTCTDICFTLFNLDLLLNYPIGAYWWNGSTWANISSADWSISNQVSFCIPIVNRSGSTEIVLDKGGDPPLPVSLSSFTAIYSDGSPTINWVTQSESDNIGWNVYRAVSFNFGQAQILNLNTIPGNGTTSEPSLYSFIDEYEVQENSTYWYWLESISGSGETESFGPVSLTITSDDNEIPEIPLETALHQNFPNPFNPSTLISFEIKENETGVLSIYNVKGQLIVKEEFGEGRHTYPWDARDHSSGIYLYKLQAKRYSKIMKMLLVK